MLFHFYLIIITLITDFEHLFYVLINHLYIFFGEICIQIFVDFNIEMFLIVLLSPKNLLYILYTSLSSNM
jgi:hypothetical protein